MKILQCERKKDAVYKWGSFSCLRGIEDNCTVFGLFASLEINAYFIFVSGLAVGFFVLSPRLTDMY